MAVVLYNAGEASHFMKISFGNLNQTEWKDKSKASIRDLWEHKDLGIFEVSFNATVESHGVVAIKLTMQT